MSEKNCVLFQQGDVRVCPIIKFAPIGFDDGRLSFDETSFRRSPVSYGVGIEVPCDDEGHWYVVSFVYWDGKHEKYDAYLDRVVDFWNTHPHASGDFQAALDFANDVVRKENEKDEAEE